MIKLLPHLLLFSIASIADELIVFPDHTARFETMLSEHLRSAGSQITLISASAENGFFEKSIIKLLGKGKKAILILRRPASASKLLAYRGLELRSYPYRDIQGSILLVDRSWGCILTSPLSDSSMANTLSFAHCSSRADFIDSLDAFRRIAIKRSEPYLEHP